MTKTQMYQLFDETFAHLRGLSETKGSEYRQEEEEMLANFNRAGAHAGVLPMTALFMFMNKHYDSICTYTRDRQTGTTREYSEDIEGRIDDLILYLLLFKGMTRDRHQGWPITWSSNGNDALMEPAPVPTFRSGLAAAGESHGARVEGLTHDGVKYTATQDLRALQHEIVTWAAQTFPDRSVDSVRLKLNTQELPELLVALGLKHWDKVGDEVSDVMILLLDLAQMLGYDVAAGIQKKMAINRRRQWIVGADGISQHVD